jgi:outer membrane lipoprotein-sorting protein
MRRVALVAACIAIYLNAFAAMAFADELLGVPPVKDDPAAHAIYDEMLSALKKADSLSYTSAYSIDGFGPIHLKSVYKVWLKKPNYARVEETIDGKLSGVIVLDGVNTWTWWPGGLPEWGPYFAGEGKARYEPVRMTSYRKVAVKKGEGSLSYSSLYLDRGMGMLIVDPSIFMGLPGFLQDQLDGVKSLPGEALSGEDCDVLEATLMQGQITWKLWVSKKSRLPLRQTETVNWQQKRVKEEQWSDIAVNAKVDDNLFKWSPPEGWTEFKFPKLEEGLIPVGKPVPDFDIVAADGTHVKLSALKGKVVWIDVWRAG